MHLKYPGACLLEYLGHMQMFDWKSTPMGLFEIAVERKGGTRSWYCVFHSAQRTRTVHDSIEHAVISKITFNGFEKTPACKGEWDQEKSKSWFFDHVHEVMDSPYSVELVKDCPAECKHDFGLSVKVQNVSDIDTKITKLRHNLSCCAQNAQLMQCQKCL